MNCQHGSVSAGLVQLLIRKIDAMVGESQAVPLRAAKQYARGDSKSRFDGFRDIRRLGKQAKYIDVITRLDTARAASQRHSIHIVTHPNLSPVGVSLP